MLNNLVVRWVCEIYNASRARCPPRQHLRMPLLVMLFGGRIDWCPMRLNIFFSQGPSLSIYYQSAPSSPNVRGVAGPIGMSVRSTSLSDCASRLPPPTILLLRKGRSSHGVMTSIWTPYILGKRRKRRRSVFRRRLVVIGSL
ncbi:hypothetical protein PENSUB_3455 [Penicillium subrubescens]|uniref:Uncharacterized protein n=1 Tax=Penicillium subrubescens TaxID=1316194 RepID=A0A1Q5UF31_9EURO|nr:hypothetical protein PENSUB_3455 [Penicillium subrubescens]